MIVKPIATLAHAASPFALLLNPAFWIAQFVLIALVAAFACDFGAEQERFKQQKNTIEQLEAQEKASALVLQRERDLRTEDRKQFDTYRKEQADASKTRSQLIADLQRDNRRLRVPIRRPTCPAADAGGSAAQGPGDEGHAELSADAGIFLVDLLARGDDAIRKHATVVDAYERLREACSKPVHLNPTPE